MGGESSKYSIIKEKTNSKPTKVKAHPAQKQKHTRQRELEVIRQLEISGFDSSISSGGVSFFMPIGDGYHVTSPNHLPKHGGPEKRQLLASTANVRSSMEGTIPVGHKKPDLFLPAYLAMERRLRAEEKQTRREQEMKVRYLQRLEEFERRRQAAEDKHRPPYTRLKGHTKQTRRR